MELNKFLHLLKKNSLILIIVPIITVIITYFLVRNLPDVYSAQAQIATGIVDDTQVSDVFGGGIVKEANANQEFSNLIEMMRLKRIIDQVSYRLIIHDLVYPVPFRKLSNEILALSLEAKKKVILEFQKKHEKQQSLNLLNPQEKALDELLHSMDYHESNLRNSLNVYRAGVSDFIYVQFDSENPELCAFVANTLSNDFSAYYSALLKENQTKSIIYLDGLMKNKFKAMNDKIQALKDYKIKNGILNVSEQSSSIYAQMMSFEAKKKDVEKDVISLSGAIKNINQKFDPTDRKYLESTLIKSNQDILNTKEKIRSLLDKQVNNDFDEWYKPKIDSLQDILSNQINNINDKYATNPLNTAQGLVDQKISLEVQLDIAKYSVKSLKDAVDTLNRQFTSLVPNEAVVQSYERDIEVASKEYLDLLNRYNQLNMESGYSGKLRIVQEAMPGTPQPTKKMLLVIISGIISFIFCNLILFVIFYLDNSIQNAKDLVNKTEIPVLGNLSLVDINLSSIITIWNTKELNDELQLFKDQLRSLRLEVGKEIKLNSKKSSIIAVDSINKGEGKTTAVLGLACAFSVTNQRVLIIDGNTSNPVITKLMTHTNYLEDYLLSGKLEIDLNKSSNVFALGNKGEDSSLEELSDSDQIQARLDFLKSKFDIIIVETPALTNVDKSREWIAHSDYVLSVFCNHQTISEDKKLHVQYLIELGKKHIGWILNMVPTQIKKKSA